MLFTGKNYTYHWQKCGGQCPFKAIIIRVNFLVPRHSQTRMDKWNFEKLCLPGQIIFGLLSIQWNISVTSCISWVSFLVPLCTCLDSIAAPIFENNWSSWQIVSEDKIQKTLLILGRGAFSTHATILTDWNFMLQLITFHWNAKILPSAGLSWK